MQHVRFYLSQLCPSNCGPLVRGHGVQDTRASQKHLSEQLQSLEQNVVLKDRVRITGLVAVRKRDEGDFDY